MTPPTDLQIRAGMNVLMRVAYDHGCWRWTGCTDPVGYGRRSRKLGGSSLVHRTVFIALRGDPGRHFVLDHLCRNPACVNPDHLEPVTIQENCRRGSGSHPGVHCKMGHEYTPENTHRRSDGFTKGGERKYKRVCATCARAWSLKYAWRERGAPKRMAVGGG